MFNQPLKLTKTIYYASRSQVKNHPKRFLSGLALLGLAVALLSAKGPGELQAVKADGCQTFPTGFSVCGRFLDYWEKNGGLAQQGYPVSEVFEEQNQPPPGGDGQVHKVQYFQRARFEEHLENAYPNDVLLGLIGTEQFGAKFGSRDPNAQFIIVRGKRTETKIFDHTPKPGYIYLVVDLLFTNTRSKKVTVSPDSVTLRTAAVYDYKVDPATYALGKYLKLTDLGVNQQVGGELAFEVPVAENPISVTVDYFIGKSTVQL